MEYLRGELLPRGLLDPKCASAMHKARGGGFKMPSAHAADLFLLDVVVILNIYYRYRSKHLVRPRATL